MQRIMTWMVVGSVLFVLMGLANFCASFGDKWLKVLGGSGLGISLLLYKAWLSCPAVPEGKLGITTKLKVLHAGRYLKGLGDQALKLFQVVTHLQFDARLTPERLEVRLIVADESMFARAVRGLRGDAAFREAMAEELGKAFAPIVAMGVSLASSTDRLSEALTELGLRERFGLTWELDVVSIVRPADGPQPMAVPAI